jgi:hypothetical protein
MPQPIVSKVLPAFALAGSLFGAGLVLPTNPPVTVHEWGTFTTVAGFHGESVSWAPLSVSSDLPCFVHTLGVKSKYMPGLVRMETPVDYFYTPAPTKVSVHVDFPGGTITEWYPKAINPETWGSIDWKEVNLRPGANLSLPSSKGASRYYAARETDAVSLQAGDENERLLFYRGMGNFVVPVVPVYENNGVRVHVTGNDALPVAIYFDNQKGHVKFQISRNVRDAFLAAENGGSIAQLRSELATELIGLGLYPKEAAAMLETWHDSWFEEGTRIIYLMPRAVIDRFVPLHIAPEPKDIQRVFVGRVEILSPATEQKILTAMVAHDTPSLEKMGRFLQPFVTQMKNRGLLAGSPDADYLQKIAGTVGLNAIACIQ